MAADQRVRYCSACGKYHTADAANAMICPHCGNSAAQPINSASMNPSSSQPPVPNRDVPNQGVRYCNACGAPNPGNAKFCLQCGQPVMAFDPGIQLDATEIKPADAGTSSDSSFPFQQAATSQYAKPLGLNRTPVIVAILLSAITLGVYIPYWFLSRRNGLNRLHADRKVPLTPIIILLVLYGLDAVATVAGVLGIQIGASNISNGITLIGGAITLFLCFRIRSMLNQHLGGERVSGGAAFLFGSEQVSGGATFFFTIYYLQYKINRLPDAHNAAPDTASASTKQSYGWLLRLPGGQSNGQRTRSSRIIGVGLLGVLVVVGIIAAIIQRNGAGSSPSLGSGSGTHICAVTHYDKKQLTCTSNDSTIASLDKAYLSVTGKDGNNFTASSLDIIINKQNSDGTFGQVGSAKLNAGLVYNVVANTVANIFVTASAAPESGATYQIEADEGSTNLGTATFTYKSYSSTPVHAAHSNAPPAAVRDLGQGVHVCTQAHFSESKDACVAEDSTVRAADIPTLNISYSDPSLPGGNVAWLDFELQPSDQKVCSWNSTPMAGDYGSVTLKDACFNPLASSQQYKPVKGDVVKIVFYPMDANLLGGVGGPNSGGTATFTVQ